MAITYSLAPIPIWYIADLTGKPLGSGYLATYSSLNHSVLKPVYTDIGGTTPWPYISIPNVGALGILFNENGSQGPFYWKFDTASPDELYYIEAYDFNGILQWTVNNFMPGGSGGGGTVTTAVSIENLVINNVFWRNSGDSANPIGTTFVRLASSTNTGLAQTVSNAGPDICFIKNNASATDQIRFLNFPLGSSALFGDVTPTQYLNYACTASGLGETQKMVQFPITSGVQNLSNQDVKITIWARATAGSNTLTLSWFQFFGDGPAASPSIITIIQTITLSNSWVKYTVSTTVPNVTGNNLGECGNDGLFLQVNYPLDLTCNIDYTKLSLYLGDLSPDEEFTTYDVIDGVIDSPRTGDVRMGFNRNLPLAAPFGWQPLNDRTIGDATSGATGRANTDTFPLYNLLWNNVADIWCPVSTGRGASAVADFVAHKTLALPRSMSRAIGHAGNGAGLTGRQLGEFLGEETHTLTIPEIPSHGHTVPIANAIGVGGLNFSSPTNVGNAINTSLTGGGGAHNNMEPTSYLLTYIKL